MLFKFLFSRHFTSAVNVLAVIMTLFNLLIDTFDFFNLLFFQAYLIVSYEYLTQLMPANVFFYLLKIPDVQLAFIFLCSINLDWQVIGVSF